MPKSSGYVSPEYLQMIASVIRPFKVNSYKLMNIKEGDRVLDLGCGPGCDTKEMAAFVGDSGKVYGVDMDEEMVEIADREVMKTGLAHRVVHLTGSVQHLPFEDNFFDSCRAERLFQVIPKEINRHYLFTEIKRVLKPGGKLVLIDTDWGSSSVDFPDSELERRLMTYFSLKMRPDGFAGRSFKRYLSEAAFENLQIDSVVLVNKTLAETVFGEWLIKTALEERVITAGEADSWITALTKRSLEETFFASVNSVVAQGCKP